MKSCTLDKMPQIVALSLLYTMQKKFCTLGSFDEFLSQPGMDAFHVIYRCLEKSFCSNLMNSKLNSVAHQ